MEGYHNTYLAIKGWKANTRALPLAEKPLAEKTLHFFSHCLCRIFQMQMVGARHLVNLHLWNPGKELSLLAVWRKLTIFCLYKQHLGTNLSKETLQMVLPKFYMRCRF